MRFLFLDFDGVLNNWEFNKSHGGWAIREGGWGPTCILDPANVAHLNKIVAATDCTIVYSTAHRKGQYAIRRCWDSLSEAGATFEMPRYQTPDLAYESATSKLIMGASRGCEIAAWIQGQVGDTPPDDLRFVVLDDLSDAWPVPIFRDRGQFIQTRLEVGLTESHAEKAIAWLLEAPQ